MSHRYDTVPGADGAAAPRLQVALTWLAGVLAAVELGAIPPVSPAVQSSLGLSFGTVAWATSGMTAVGAALGIPVGWWTSRFCARCALLTGLVALSAAAGLCTFARSWPMLLGLRTAEGAGYLLVFVAGPIVLTRLTQGRAQAAALALWGTCVPTGVALATAVGGALASRLPWSCWLGLTGVGPLAVAVLLALALPHLPSTATARRSRTAGTWVRFLAPAGAYAFMSLVSVAIVVVLSEFLLRARHETFAQAGAEVAVVSAGSAVGGLLASWLLRRGVTVGALAPFAVLMPLACLPAFSAGVPLGAGVTAAVLVLLVNGLLISAVYAAVPAIARRPEDVDLANGALTQLGSLGALVGPPLYGLAVGYAGWGGTVAATLLFAGLGTWLLLVTARSAARPAPDSLIPSARLPMSAPDSAAQDSAQDSAAQEDIVGGRPE
ncbi:MFS transporter [Actinacidiphila acididurans]|uniref:MFS transporter n=1 Tax=Actinacidiphila acididurans TaxID=2784346 RepID=A0ABS2U0E4_9ACTN|nr:MFS transporter [Actinacidiphila acididurans]MBM9509046.1 MFS transporter [Actinacidiphila acididurans]